jgi:hypothetical protein
VSPWETWLRGHVEPVGRAELVFERPWAAIRRVPAAGGAVWLKECAPVQAFEPRLTAALAERWPDRLPRVIAHDDERRWLLLADAGERLGIGGDPEPWLELLPRYAELQRGEAARVEEHVAAGVPDRRLVRFPELFEQALAAGLLDLRAFAPRFAELCAELAAAGIPETTQHDDLHGNNVFRDGGALRILDWGDSCVSHPFLTARVTFVHLFLAPDDPWRARLRDAYLEPWGRPAELRGPFELAQRLAPFAHLFVLQRVLEATGELEHTPDLASTVAEAQESTR